MPAVDSVAAVCLHPVPGLAPTVPEDGRKEVAGKDLDSSGFYHRHVTRPRNDSAFASASSPHLAI